MFKKMKLSNKIFVFMSLMGLPNVVLFIWQVTHGVVSLVNIIPTIPFVVILFCGIKNLLNPKVRSGEVLPKMYGLDKPDIELEKGESKKNVDFYFNKMAFPHDKKPLLLPTIIFCVIFVGIAMVSMILKFSNNYEEIVTGHIVDQVYLVESSSSVSSSGASSSRKSTLIMTVSYIANNEEHTIEIKDTMALSKMEKLEIDLCIDEKGEFVCVYGQMIKYDIICAVCVFVSILAIMGCVLRFPVCNLAALVVIVVGVVLFAFANVNNWSGCLLHTLTVFGGLFVTVGLMTTVEFLVLRIAFDKGRKIDPNYTVE